MTDEPQTAGTTGQDDGDAAKPTTGTPEPADRDAEPSDIERLNLEWKAKAERTNAAEREAAEAKAEVERLRRAQSPAAHSPGVDPRQQQLREAYAWAQGKDGQLPDPVAAVSIDNAIRNEMLQNRLAERDALDEIDDPVLRKAVKKQLDADNQRLGGTADVKAALAEIRAAKLEEVEAENARLNEALRSAQAPSGTAPPTHSREVSASTLKARTMSEEQNQQELLKMTPLQRMARAEEVEKGMRGEGGIIIKG